MSQENFNVTGAKNGIAQDRINVAFKNIQTLIDEYQPLYTTQDYGILSFSGTFHDGEKFYVDDLPTTELNVFGLYGTTYIKIGTLSTAGELTIHGNFDYVVVYQPYRVDRNAEEKIVVREQKDRG